jgi:hypothetical protein
VAHLLFSLDVPIGIGPLRRGSLRVYRHYAVGVIDVSKIVLIVYVFKLSTLSNCQLVSLTLMVLCTWGTPQKHAVMNAFIPVMSKGRSDDTSSYDVHHTPPIESIESIESWRAIELIDSFQLRRINKISLLHVDPTLQ